MMSFLSAAMTALTMWNLIDTGESNYWGARRDKEFRRMREIRRATNDDDTRVTRKVQDQDCPKMEFFMNCDQYFFGIWDGDGKHVYDSYLYGTDYSECYDPTACYLYEIASESGNCNYEIVMDGKVVREGKAIYDPDGASLVIRAGECTETCPGKNELVVLSYIEYGDIDYILHISDQGDVEGLILEGDAESFCIDIEACNVIVRTKAGWSFYFLLDKEEVLDMGGFEKTRTFGNCSSTCPDTTLLMSTNPSDGGLNSTLTVDSIVTYDNYLNAGEEAYVCIDTYKCNILDVQGFAYYYFFRDGEVIDRGLAHEYRLLGPCVTKCMGRPTLATTERGRDIVTLLSTVSGMATLADFNSVRYKAACWLVNDDLRALEANDPKLLQRYVLSVIYLTTDGPNWEAQLSFMSGKDECNWEAVGCNTQNVVDYIYLGFNQLLGTLASEIYSLIGLEFLNMSDNKLSGKIPKGMSRLPIKYIDMIENEFTGSIPQDFFLIDEMTHIAMGRNLLTGTFPNAHKDLSKVASFWFQDNLLSGTIPQWFDEITELKYLYLHYNMFTGQIPDYKLPNLHSFWAWENDFNGTLPSSLFLNPSLQELIVSNNRISGPITIPEGMEKSLVSLWLDNNQFTGTLPAALSQLNKLQQLLLNNNTFSGTFPQEMNDLKKIYNLRIEDNNITGTVPFDNCKKFTMLSADCDAPLNVDCPCCTLCSGLYTTYIDVLACPSSVLNIEYFSKPNDMINYYVENTLPQLVASAWEYSKYDGLSFDSCISPTDCLTLTSTSDAPFNIAVNGILLFEQMKGSGAAKIRFGYADDGTMKPNTCDDLIICNRSILPNTPQRRLVNLITRIAGLDIFSGLTSNPYDSLCWWIKDLERLTEAELESTVLVQRYFLALLYNGNGGPGWFNNQHWMSDLPECEWFGVKCDTYEGIISTIDLSKNNLVGTLQSEIGEIRGLEHLILSSNKFIGSIPLEIVKLKMLKTLNLSDNRIDGTIPSEVKFLKSLQDLDLNTNRLTSSLPSEVSILINLRTITLGNNALSGEIPVEILALTKLKSISVNTNLMSGKLGMLADLPELEYMDFSGNYFFGVIPLNGYKQRNLVTARLNNNQFSGAIPKGIEELTNLKELLVYGNMLTGSLPSQLGKLHNITSLSFAYNLLKGTISSELANMNKLNLLHLHSNSLVGNSDHFNYSIRSFITDCGKTVSSEASVSCPACTQCCNSDQACITVSRTWPGKNIKNLKLSPPTLVLLCSVGVSLILMGLSVFLQVFNKKLPRLPYYVRLEFQQDSVYRWYLSSFKMGWFCATLSVGLQLWILLMFLQAGDYTFEGNLWLYSINCPDDGTSCVEQKKTNQNGWIMFSMILAIFLLQDFIPGVLLFYESSVEFCIQGIFSGVVLMNITILSTIASTLFLYATSISNIAIIKDAVIVLFLNSIDEQIFMICHRLFPNWADDVEVNIMNKCLNKITQEISEVVDDNFSDYGPTNKKNVGVNVDEIFGDNSHEIAPTREDKGEYEDYGIGNIKYADNGVPCRGSPVSDINFEAVKADIISEIMGLHAADKAIFTTAHETEKAHILDELKKVQEENKKVQEENKKVQEENKKVQEENKKVQEENKKVQEEMKKIQEDNSKLKAAFNTLNFLHYLH